MRTQVPAEQCVPKTQVVSVGPENGTGFACPEVVLLVPIQRLAHSRLQRKGSYWDSGKGLREATHSITIPI